MRPDLVIFDCDGVLVDSEAISLGVVQANLARHGFEISKDGLVAEFVGGALPKVEMRLRAAGARLPDLWHKAVYAKMFAALAAEVEPIPGIADVLDALDAAAIPYCIASNGPDAKMDVTLARTGLMGRFEGRIFSAHSVGLDKAKPDPGLFLHAAAAMGFAPEQACVVEDSATGAKAARRAGIRCFGYAAEGQDSALAAEGAVVFNDMLSLPPLLCLYG